MIRSLRMGGGPGPALWLAVTLFVVSAANAPARGQGGSSKSDAKPASNSPAVAGGSDAAPKPSQADTPPPSISSSLGPYADPGGLRATFAKHGITYSLSYTGEVLSNAKGGIRRGSIYEGLLDFQLDVDLGKAAGWSDAQFHTNLYQIHGHGLSRYYVGNLFTVSDIEAVPASRLYEIWLEQKLFNDTVSIRFGQLAADSEFLVSDLAALFLNATTGWPALTASNLPSGGPAYPLATPAIRVKVTPNENVSAMIGLFNGDPSGPGGTKDPQRRDRSGFEFRTTDPALLIGEVALSHGSVKDAASLPGTLKMGGFQHFGRFNDQHFGTDGRSLADPDSTGKGRLLRGNSGMYVVVEQSLYRVPDKETDGIGIFARAAVSPSDRNVISSYFDGGLTFSGLLPSRPGDTFGVAAAYARISSSARALDRDAQAFASLASLDPNASASASSPRPVRSSEALVEATYQATIIPGWTLQPSVQYIIRPGANVANSRDPEGRPIQNAVVFGLRTTISY